MTGGEGRSALTLVPLFMPIGVVVGLLSLSHLAPSMVGVEPAGDVAVVGGLAHSITSDLRIRIDFDGVGPKLGSLGSGHTPPQVL
jgi:hypothetical protein